MAKAELKTKQTEAGVNEFLQTIADEQQRIDSARLIEIFTAETGEPPKMWGSSIIGFGQQHLKYDSGRELDWMLCGFSPRKATLTLYLSCAIDEHAALLEKLGKYKTGKGCLYIKRLADTDETVLAKLIRASMKRKGVK